MAKGITFEVEGLNRLLKQIERYGEKVQQEVGFEIQDAGLRIAAEAKSRVPANLGKLGQQIFADKVSDLTVEIVSGAPYSAYVEFGTGPFAASYLAGQPQEVKDYARQFYVNGEGQMPAMPFLFPAYYAEQKELVKRIKAVLKDAKL